MSVGHAAAAMLVYRRNYSVVWQWPASLSAGAEVQRSSDSQNYCHSSTHELLMLGCTSLIHATSIETFIS